MRGFLGALTLVALASACAPTIDLQAVSQYAQTAADANTSFASVAADFYQGCLRRRELQLQPRELPQTLIDLAPAYTAASPLPVASAMPGIPCGQERNISAEWDKRNRIVLGYIQAVGAIAGVDVRPTFAPLGDALVSAKLISQTQDDAFTQLAQQIAATAIRGEQREAIATTVQRVNPSLKTAVNALKIVDDAYGQTLNAEYNLTFAYYNTLIRSELPKKAGTQLSPAGRDRIGRQRERYAQALAAVNDRRASTVAYAAVLDDIQSTHEQFYDASQSRPSLQAYIAIVRADVLPLYQDVEALRQAIK